MRKGGLCALAASVFLSGLASEAGAAGTDFKLNARRDGQGIFFTEQLTNPNDPTSVNFVANERNWEQLVGELSYVFSPRLMTPAETLGYAGFSVGVLWSGTFVSSDQPYWFATETAQRTGEPDGVLQTLQVDVRKGLPFSFELGTNLVWLTDSEMFAPGMELRWALQEGFEIAPDLGVRGAVNHVVGAPDLNMTIVGLDVVVSKGFGILGMVHLAPYLSYSVLLTDASARIIDPTPTDETDPQRALALPSIGAGDNVQHKITVGARALFYVVNLSVQGEFQFLKDTPSGRELFGNVATISTKLGLDF